MDFIKWKEFVGYDGTYYQLSEDSYAFHEPGCNKLHWTKGDMTSSFIIPTPEAQFSAVDGNLYMFEPHYPMNVLRIDYADNRFNFTKIHCILEEENEDLKIKLSQNRQHYYVHHRGHPNFVFAYRIDHSHYTNSESGILFSLSAEDDLLKMGPMFEPSFIAKNNLFIMEKQGGIRRYACVRKGKPFNDKNHIWMGGMPVATDTSAICIYGSYFLYIAGDHFVSVNIDDRSYAIWKTNNPGYSDRRVVGVTSSGKITASIRGETLSRELYTCNLPSDFQEKSVYTKCVVRSLEVYLDLIRKQYEKTAETPLPVPEFRFQPVCETGKRLQKRLDKALAKRKKCEDDLMKIDDDIKNIRMEMNLLRSLPDN